MQVKRKLVRLVFLAGLLSVETVANPILYWGCDKVFESGFGVVYTNGVLVPAGTHWLVELIDTSDGSVLYSTTDGFIANGYFLAQPDATAWNGKVVRTVVYDAATKELASLQAHFSGGATLLSWSAVSAPATFNYNAGYVSASIGPGPGQWHSIPEPTVAALLGVFGGGLLAARRIFRSS